MSETAFTFRVHPSVVYKLGEDLVTDEVQALVELVKNSYDADASYANVRIQTTPDDDEDGGGENAFVEVSDDGVGMKLEAIRRGWLTISDSPKVAMKRAGETTDKGRTPLGDKGLGRLAAQRLGDVVTICTIPADGSTAHKVSFDWRDFRNYEALTDVPVEVTPIRRPDRRRGTSMRITKLRDGGAWASDTTRLQNELSKLISPYEGVEKFRLVTVVDGERLDLADIGVRMRRGALVHYDITFDGAKLTMKGSIRLALLRPPIKADRAEFARDIESDRGRALQAFLLEKPQARDLKMHRGTGGWFLQYERTEYLSELPKVALIDGIPASPGPFDGEIDGFSLARAAVAEQEVFDSASEFRGLIHALAGIRVYREGFGVRVGDDWLQLGRQWSSGSSWYGLKPQTTLGYVAISARDNAQLVETTDREGFKETPAFLNMRYLMRRFLKFSQDSQEFVGRYSVEFRRTQGEEPEDAETLDEAVKGLEGALERGHTYALEASSLREELVRAALDAEGVIEALDTNDETTAEISETLQAMARNAAAATVLLDGLQLYGQELSGYTRVGRDLQSRMATVESQLEVAYETVGLGLTAEALAHEIKNIADRLARRTTDVNAHMRRKGIEDVRVQSFVDHVKTTVAALRRQMAHLAPSLRYVRERREEMSLQTILEDIADFHRSRWKERKIPVDIRLDISEDADFVIKMNRGKFQQIVDNLVFNSDYWLREDLRANRIDSGVITISSDEPYLLISDNGLGVSPTVESSLFEPFVSDKPSEVGRGLGLFIVQQLLSSEGCSVSLLPVRNRAKRRHVFQLDLAGAVVE